MRKRFFVLTVLLVALLLVGCLGKIQEVAEEGIWKHREETASPDGQHWILGLGKPQLLGSDDKPLQFWMEYTNTQGETLTAQCVGNAQNVHTIAVRFPDTEYAAEFKRSGTGEPFLLRNVDQWSRIPDSMTRDLTLLADGLLRLYRARESHKENKNAKDMKPPSALDIMVRPGESLAAVIVRVGKTRYNDYHSGDKGRAN